MNVLLIKQYAMLFGVTRKQALDIIRPYLQIIEEKFYEHGEVVRIDREEDGTLFVFDTEVMIKFSPPDYFPIQIFPLGHSFFSSDEEVVFSPCSHFKNKTHLFNSDNLLALKKLQDRLAKGDANIQLEVYKSIAEMFFVPKIHCNTNEDLKKVVKRMLPVIDRIACLNKSGIVVGSKVFMENGKKPLKVTKIKDDFFVLVSGIQSNINPRKLTLVE